MRSSPFSIQITLLQMRRSTVVECETMQHRCPAADQLADALFALFAEKAVPHAEHLIQDEHPGHLTGRRDGEGQARYHAGGIMTHLFFHEPFQSGKRDDLFIMRVEKGAAVPAQRAVEIHILPAAELMVETCAQRQRVICLRSARTVPSLGAYVPQMMRSSVLLPEPLVPTMPTTSPRRTVKLTAHSAVNHSCLRSCLSVRTTRSFRLSGASLSNKKRIVT